MPSRRTVNLLWPAGGIHRRAGFQQQPPYTCIDALNVRTQEPVTLRERGGPRSGLRRSYATQLGGGEPVRLLAQVRESVSGTKSIYDDFNYSSYPSAWEAASWLDGIPDLHPDSAPTYTRTTSVSTNGLGLVYQQVADFDATADYSLAILINPVGAGATTVDRYGDYEISLRMDDTTPDASADGVRLILEGDVSGGSNIMDATLRVSVSSADTDYPLVQFSGGSPARPVWAVVAVSGSSVTVTVDGNNLGTTDISAHGAAAGTRFGFGQNSTGNTSSTTLQTWIDAFRFDYIPDATDTPSRVWTLAASAGTLYRSETDGVSMAEVNGDSTLNPDVPLYGVEYLGKLYIADYSEDANVSVTNGVVTGTNTFDSASVSDWTTVANADDDILEITDGSTVGTFPITAVTAGSLTVSGSPANDTGVSARVVRAPKVWDSSSNTISKWAATAGYMPVDCPLICRFMGGIVLAGAKRFPHIAYHSASGDPDDWDTGSTSPTGAYATTLAETDVIAQPIRALIPYKDDYLIYGCTTQMWVQRGSLRLGGTTTCVSRTIGILGPSAWCFTPEGMLVWMSHDGIYMMPASGGTPEPVSREKLPDEFLNLDPETIHVQLSWEYESRGVKINPTTIGQDRDHWFLHWKYGAFWRERYAIAHQTTATLPAIIDERPKLLIGCADGYIREHSRDVVTDDGTSFSSRVDYGPIRMGRADFQGGELVQMVATLGYSSAQAAWAAFFGETAEEVIPPYYGNALQELTTEAGTTLTTEGGDEITTEAVAATSGTWAAKMNYASPVNRRGGAFLLEVSNVDSAITPWLMENVACDIVDGGLVKA